MGEMKKKRFKEPSDYYLRFFLGTLAIIGGVFFSIYDGIFVTEQELFETWDKKIPGTSRARAAESIIKFFLFKFGKTGFMFLLIGNTFLILCYLFNRIAEYRRYKKKCRLFHEGLIENFYDIYDDHVPLLSWRRLKMFFTRKEKPVKKKFPNKRTMKKQIRESEKYFEQKNKNKRQNVV